MSRSKGLKSYCDSNSNRDLHRPCLGPRWSARTFTETKDSTDSKGGRISRAEGERYMTIRTVILDIDGTLVDTNFHHALAWFRAFRHHNLTLPLWRIHRHIGMGGDHFVEALAGATVEKELGDDIRPTEARAFMKLIDEVQPM